MSEFLRDYARRFAALNKDNLERLGELYADDIAFADPMRKAQGLAEVRRYFAELYANVSDLQFEFHAFDQVREGKGYLRWTRTYCHPRLNQGEPIAVQGCSHLLWAENKVFQHRDFFDAGALLYEHVPVMGRMIRWLKRRLA
ncbi:nuclear transport factor 2 family protein [Pseudomonas sp. NFR16]|uniref:nuclear transport factor 2 family protein n=1 Tax=Pseudomonas sp. NFR16 TaxID=1566248 RepID=UPI0008D2DE03|nr:nuclear transport factor 2 family protein [Pseudomonas sp. NFR16]SEJ20887.1 SnoaL-like domain-containing protein [Pseudomonas sp. NFR16]